MNYQVVIPVLISFVISVILGPIIIPFLRKLKMGQTERVEGVQSHLKKAGTPTMGGIIFLIATVVTSLFYVKDLDCDGSVLARGAAAEVFIRDDDVALFDLTYEIRVDVLHAVLCKLIGVGSVEVSCGNYHVGVDVVLVFENRTFSVH